MSTLRPFALTCATFLALGVFACGSGDTDPAGPVGAPLCDNDIQDPGEEDVDCGGPCTPCGQAPTCTDAFDNGDETDVDCGGATCPQCGEGKGCDRNGDCTTGVCNDGICAAPGALCTNNVKDPDESDIDCGGSCPGCPTSKMCRDHGDCLSDTCVFGICRDPSCTDGVANQDETDVDCGGATCDACPNESRCRDLSDCASNTCIDGVCQPEGSSGGTCEVEGDCDSGFYCDFKWNESSGPSADLDRSCLVERAGSQPGEVCVVDEDCAGIGCYQGFCSQVCRADDACVGNGATCVPEEIGIDPDENGAADLILPIDICLAFDNAGGSCLAHTDCPNGKRCTVYLDRNLQGDDLDPDGPYKAAGRCQDQISGAAAEGETCEFDSECRSGYCGRQGICSRTCQSSSECSPVAIDGVGTPRKRLCQAYPRWLGGEWLGGPFDATRFVYLSECQVVPGQIPTLNPCGPTAPTPFTCAGGETCKVVHHAFGPDVKAEAEYFCFWQPGNGTARLGANCPDDGFCRSGICILDDNGENGQCSQLCGNDTDCGASGLTCQQVDLVERKGKYLGNGLSVGYCLR